MNQEFKAYAKAKKVKLYQVASELGLRPPEFSVQYMRHKLSSEEEDQLRAIVDELSRGM